MDKYALSICKMFISLLSKRHSIHLVCENPFINLPQEYSDRQNDTIINSRDNEKTDAIESRLNTLKEIWRQLCNILPPCKKYNDILLSSVSTNHDDNDERMATTKIIGINTNIDGGELVVTIRDKLEILADRFSVYVLSCNYESVSSQGKDFISIVETDSQEFLDMDISKCCDDDDDDNDGYNVHDRYTGNNYPETVSNTASNDDNDAAIVVNLSQFSENGWKQLLLNDTTSYIPAILPHAGKSLSSVLDSVL